MKLDYRPASPTSRLLMLLAATHGLSLVDARQRACQRGHGSINTAVSRSCL